MFLIVISSFLCAELRKLAASRPAFTQAASSLGFPATSLLELPAFDAEDPSSVTYASARITSWLQAQGADPVTARVAVRVEQGTSVLGAGIGRGVEKIVIGAAALCEEHVAASVVLEQVMPGAVFFTVAVLQSPESGRPVALTPTEVSYKDLEEEFMAFELRLDRFFAVNGGQDPEKVDALMALMLEESQLHPAIMGGQASASQHIVHATPPSSLPASTVENIRAAAAKLFVDLEIRDFAQFSGWVVPDDPVAAAGLGPAMDLWAQVNAGEAQGGVNDNGAAPQPSKGKTFAELAQIDAAERAALAAEMRSVGGAGVTAEDIAGAVDVEIYTHEADKDEPDAALANGPVLREVGESLDSAPVRYGKFAGFELGDLTREDLKAARVVEPATPIPNGLPEVSKPTELGDLSALDPGALCRTPSGIITFNQVCLTADLGNRLSPLAQQMAVAGLPYSALARQLVSWAASRAGLPPLPPTPALLEDPEVAEDWPIGRGLDAPEETLPSGPSMDEIGAAIESWAVPEAQPLPESYEDIRTNGALVSESDEEADAAAAAAGLDADVAVAATVEALNNDSGTDDDDGDMVMPPSDAVVLAQRFPGLHPTRQRVWILCGGEGPLKDGSLHAAVHAMAALHGAPDLLIETFFLDPPFAGAK